MIEEVDNQVRDWLKNVAGDAAISFALPAADAQQLSLYAYLFDIDRPQAAASGRTPPIVLRLGYLVTAAGPDPIGAHAVLGKVIAAADTDPQYTLEFGQPAAAAWAAVNLPVRASVILRASASQDRAGKLAPPVRSARVDAVSLEPLSGRVVAGDGTPLAGALIEVPSIGKTATSNADGRFTLEGLTNALDLLLNIRAKGIEKEVRHPAQSPADYTIVMDVK